MPAIRSDAASRAYKACLSCRKRKIRCDLGVSNQPPCQRCQRESRECTIPEERSSKRQTPGREPLGGTTPTVPHHLGDRDAFARSVVVTPAQPRQERDAPIVDVSSRPTPQHITGANLEDAIIRTTVASGNDALGLLFHEVRSGQDVARSHSPGENRPAMPSVEVPASTQSQRNSSQAYNHPRNSLVQVNHDVKSAWNASKLGQMGWLRADEVVSLLNDFFYNMVPLTPIMEDRHYSCHPEFRNHHYMISQEPLLCAVILMISSRYNPIPGSPSLSHAFHIHSCIWRYCQQLVTSITFGQSRNSLGGDVSYGIILALLLLCEWHPRAIHFPPDTDGLGGSAMSTLSGDVEQAEHERWLCQVHDAVQCSDRMSIMLVGCALTLSHELHIFDDAEGDVNEPSLRISRHRPHARRVLYLFAHLLADKPTFTSLLPEKLSHFLADNPLPEIIRDPMQNVTHSWLELSNLWRSFREMAPSMRTTAPRGTGTRTSLSLVDHFTMLLTQWSHKHIPGSYANIELKKIETIEYHYVQIQCNAFGMQTLIERINSNEQRATSSGASTIPPTAATTPYAERVTTHCSALLEIIVGMHNADSLRFAPVRVFMRTIAASVLLLKTLAIGVRTNRLKSALSLLDQVVQALKTSAIDDVHLARHYATLLKSCLEKARSSFATVGTRQPTPGWATPMQTVDQRECQAAMTPALGTSEQHNNTETNLDLAFDPTGDEWWALPFGQENDIFNDIIPGDGDFQSFGFLGSGL